MKLPVFLAICLVSFAESFSATAGPVDLNPVQDNTIYSDSDNSAGTYIGLFVGRTNSATVATRRALIAFDLSSIPSGATINSVTVTMNVNTVGGGDTLPRSYSLYELTSDWGEGSSSGFGGVGGGGAGNGSAATVGSSTWNYSTVSQAPPSLAGTLWTSPGGDFVATASATTTVPALTGQVSWSSAQLVNDVQGWLNTPGTNFGWILIGDEVDKGAIRIFDSREASGTGTLKPTLSIEYTPLPEPSSAFILALGGIILACSRVPRRNTR